MTGTTLDFEPLIAPALWVALAVVSAVVLTMYAWRRPGRLPRHAFFSSPLRPAKVARYH